MANMAKLIILSLLGFNIWNCGTDEIPDSVLNPPKEEPKEEVAEVSAEYNFSTTLQGFPLVFVFKLYDDSTYAGGIGNNVLDGGSFSISGTTIAFTAEGDCKIMLGPSPTAADCPDPYTGALSATGMVIENYRDTYGDLDLELVE